MTRVIWKFPLKVAPMQMVHMPRGSALLFPIQVQDGVPTMWALCDPDAPKEEKYFKMVGTGQAFDASGASFIGSMQIGAFVWHYFDVT